VNGIIFSISFSVVHYWYTEMLLIFLYWFCILLICLKCSWDSRVFGWSFHGLWGMILYHLQIEIFDFFLSYLNPFCFFLLYYCSRNSSTILNKSQESGQPCLIPDFRENGFRFSLFNMLLAMGLLTHNFLSLIHLYLVLILGNTGFIEWVFPPLYFVD
jgi:hypothetical protein